MGKDIKHLYLERQLIGMPIRTSGPILQPSEAVILVAIVDLIARFAGDPKLPSQDSHLLAIEQAGHKSESFIHMITLFPGHLRTSPNAELCNLCVRKRSGAGAHATCPEWSPPVRSSCRGGSVHGVPPRPGGGDWEVSSQGRVFWMCHERLPGGVLSSVMQYALNSATCRSS